jgi:hypothetical protein
VLDELGSEEEDVGDEQATVEPVQEPASQEDLKTASSAEDRSEQEEEDKGGTSAPGDRSEEKDVRRRQKQKYASKQRRSRLKSYVMSAESTEEEHEADDSRYKRNIQLEDISRRIVCEWEEARGRSPEPQHRLNAGWDIVSTDPITEQRRLIEVKATSGEWDATGVGLTYTQFSNAQDYGDEYWLYVVEFADDPDSATVHPIQNPATKVGSFMFDDGWRDAAEEDLNDIRNAYRPGARVEYSLLGRGTITRVDQIGHSTRLIVDFDRRGEKSIPFNLTALKLVVDEDEG